MGKLVNQPNPGRFQQSLFSCPEGVKRLYRACFLLYYLLFLGRKAGAGKILYFDCRVYGFHIYP